MLHVSCLFITDDIVPQQNQVILIGITAGESSGTMTDSFHPLGPIKGLYSSAVCLLGLCFTKGEDVVRTREGFVLYITVLTLAVFLQ